MTRQVDGLFGLDLARRRFAGWPAIALVMAIDTVVSVFFNLVVYERGWLLPLAHATDYLIRPSLFAYLIQTPLVLLIVCTIGRQRPRELGIEARRLPAGIVFTVALWLLVNLLGFLARHEVGAGLPIDAYWETVRASALAGSQITNAMNGFFEEVLFRGFLLIQAYVIIEGRRKVRRPAWAGLIVPLLISQAYFAAGHIPNRLYLGFPPAQIMREQAGLIAIGALCALIYLRSGNIFMAMGTHILLNSPLSLFLPQAAASVLIGVTALIVVLPWRPAWRRFSPAWARLRTETLEST